jgi:site-specific DNA-cytosine methylase
MGIAEEMANSLRAGRVGSVVDVFAFGANNSAAQGDSVSLSVTPALDISKVPAVLSFDWQKGNDVTNVRPSTMSVTEEQAGTLSTTRVPAVLVPVCATDHVTHSLTHEGHDASEDGTGRGTPIVSYFDKQALGIYGENGVASTVSARDYKDATDLVVAATLRHKTHPTSRAGEGEIILGTQRQQVDGAMVATAGIPRRLMPVECERLMGWDDGWTDIPDAKGKPASDAARYKACGNGVVSQCGEWIGERLIAAHTDMLAECAA